MHVVLAARWAILEAVQARVAREIGGVFLLTSAVTWAITYGPWPLFRDHGHVLLAAAFLFSALALARRDPGGPRRFGIDLEGILDADGDERPGVAGVRDSLARALPSLGRELLVALAVCALIFPPYFLAFRLWHRVQQPFTFHLPPAPLDFLLNQLIVVALPEEALFRGYFQTRLADIFPRTLRLGRHELPVAAIVLQALLFGMLHFLVGFHPARLAVFFPGLLFGVLRSMRGGIGAAIWFHAFSNLLSEILARGYL